MNLHPRSSVSAGVLAAVAVAGLALALAAPVSAQTLFARLGPNGEQQLELPILATDRWDDRNYFVNLPPGFPDGAPYPVILVLHGAGSEGPEIARTTCRGLTPSDRPSLFDPTCLHEMAAGAITVYPNGAINTSDPYDFTGEYRRNWNAGGDETVGGEYYKCVTGTACENGANDVAYLMDVLFDLGSRYPIDRTRVYAAGLSNGAGMVHRLACEAPLRIGGVVAIAGTSHQHVVNLAADRESCRTRGNVGIMQIYGDGDLISPPEGGPSPLFPEAGSLVSVEESFEGFVGVPGWVDRNGCMPVPVVEPIPDSVPLDGTFGGERLIYTGCDRGDVVVTRIDGAGHTWPDGWQYATALLIGPTTRDLSANEEILDFFSGLAGRDLRVGVGAVSGRTDVGTRVRPAP